MMERVLVLDGGKPWGVRLHAATAPQTDRRSDNCSVSPSQQQQQQQHATVAKVRLHHQYHHQYHLSRYFHHMIMAGQ